MEGYPESKKMMIKEDCEDTRLELRLSPPGHGFYSVGNRCPSKILVSNKRVAQTPGVVGWPPVRTSRRNIMTYSTKVPPAKIVTADDDDNNNNNNDNKKLIISGSDIIDQENSLYVKINMDGVAIGRKVDLKAYDTYHKLSSAVDQLFRGLLAAQGDFSSGISNKQRDISAGLLNGTGEYTLVYEDNEGDRILVGDVPWDMFISSAKRLRVLKTSELSVIRQRHN